MFTIHENEKEYRHGDHGPKYLMMGPKSNFGIVQLLPGNVVPPHYHEIMEENFYILEGTVSMTVDGTERTFRHGDFIHLEPGEIHQLENKTGSVVRFVVTTSPFMDHADKVEV
ncbi:cupin domain-containing protein [Eubacterium sp. 1001713B170207_170306_E7]|uniref:cupin domain-containing protein n=1 Tax=Eubacterium sp. 1001713B170207_170306_E7 TaxID=2787097 RepID=UPI00189B9E30|nr:cupin domain-containing protein [Eubacterium sp. 1001713B170207_170306_E7]